MRVEDLIAELSTFDPKAEVQVFTAFDDNGPEEWNPPEIWEYNGVVRIEPVYD
jgi:hypothetical protein